MMEFLPWHYKTASGCKDPTIGDQSPPVGVSVATLHFHLEEGLPREFVWLRLCSTNDPAGNRIDHYAIGVERRVGFSETRKLLAPITNRALMTTTRPFLLSINDDH
jgi:hypothetical protein